MPRAERIVVYEWEAWHGYVADRMLRSSTRLAMHRDVPVHAIVGALPADTRGFLFHVNLSITSGAPAQRAELVAALVERGVGVINHGATDVTKPALQTACRRQGLPVTACGPNGDPAELVIVKTVLNCGGITEKLAAASGVIMQDSRLIARDIGTPGVGYPVLRRESVAKKWWSDPSVVVEKFIENPRGSFARIHLCGSRAAITVAESPSRIKKISSSRIVDRRLVDLTESETQPTWQDLVRQTRAIAREMHLDFGAIDFVQDGNGHYYAIDVNTTPYWGHGGQSSNPLSHSYLPVLAHLASGCDSF